MDDPISDPDVMTLKDRYPGGYTATFDEDLVVFTRPHLLPAAPFIELVDITWVHEDEWANLRRAQRSFAVFSRSLIRRFADSFFARAGPPFRHDDRGRLPEGPFRALARPMARSWWPRLRWTRQARRDREDASLSGQTSPASNTPRSRLARRLAVLPVWRIILLAGLTVLLGWTLWVNIEKGSISGEIIFGLTLALFVIVLLSIMRLKMRVHRSRRPAASN